MGFLIKSFGAAATLMFAFALLRGYKSYLEKRKKEREGFISLFEAVRDDIDCFLSPLSKIFERFTSGESTLSRISLRIKNGESPKFAYNAEKDGLHVGDVGKEILAAFFSSLGKGYREGAVAMSESCRKRFLEYSEISDVEDEKNAKLAGALTVGAALGIIILFI